MDILAIPNEEKEKLGRGLDRHIEPTLDGLFGKPRDMLSEDERDAIDHPPPDETPNLDTTETLERDPVASRPTILITPDGEELTEDEYLEKYPDQSGTLPQGTVVQITDASGHEYKIDMIGADRNAMKKMRSALNRLQSKDSRTAVSRLVEGGRLEQVGQNDVILDMGSDEAAAKQRFEDALSSAGIDPGEVIPFEQDGETSGAKIGAASRYQFKDGTQMICRSHSRDGRVTVEVVLSPRGSDGRKTRNVKTRFGVREKE